MSRSQALPRAVRSASRATTRSRMDLTTNQAAAELGVSAQRVRQYIAEGRLRARRIGRDYLVDSESVAAFSPRPPGNPDLASAREIKKRRREADTAD